MFRIHKIIDLLLEIQRENYLTDLTAFNQNNQ